MGKPAILAIERCDPASVDAGAQIFGSHAACGQIAGCNRAMQFWKWRLATGHISQKRKQE
jgi:hypothetical protein